MCLLSGRDESSTGIDKEYCFLYLLVDNFFQLP